MLGHALYKTNCFGFPLEYANPANLTEWKKRLAKKNLAEVLTELQRRRTSPNGVFSIKIQYSQIKQFGDFQNLVALLPNAYFLLLSREDVLRQAVSLSKAKQTGKWISGQKPVKNNPTYNFKDIDKYLRQFILDNSSWKYFLAANGCNYIEMRFEQVLNNLTQSIKKIASFVDIEIQTEQIPEKQVTKKQSDVINANWTNKFVSDFNYSRELLNKKKVLKEFFKKIKKLLYT